MIICDSCFKQQFLTYICNDSSEQLPRRTRGHNYQKYLFGMTISRNDFQQFARIYLKSSHEFLGTIIWKDHSEEISETIILEDHSEEISETIILNVCWEWLFRNGVQMSYSKELFRRDVLNNCQKEFFCIVVVRIRVPPDIYPRHIPMRALPEMILHNGNQICIQTIRISYHGCGGGNY